MARRPPGQPGFHRRTFALLVRYDGGPYKGWQPHPELPTVCGVLSAVLHRAGVLRLRLAGTGGLFLLLPAAVLVRKSFLGEGRAGKQRQ